ncbi:hypothetical protein B6S59_08960 [Pseudomonas sp. A46]|nr:hypothetical protein B6S59_08960 [Pseudomonas sp. A46]
MDRVVIAVQATGTVASWEFSTDERLASFYKHIKPFLNISLFLYSVTQRCWLEIDLHSPFH